MDFAIRLILQKNCNKSCSLKKIFGLVEMTIVHHTIYNLPEWQAVKLTFFAACICSVFFGAGWGCLFIVC